MNYDYAIHSDYLIHWTGKDIDEELDPQWYDKHNIKTAKEVDDRYLQRLHDILSFGLWLTDEPEWEPIPDVVAPKAPVCCFTELKLSQSRTHARRYGRLGIGVKRAFVFQRFGRPLCYFGFGDTHNDRFLKACATDLSDKSLLHFFKKMNSSSVLNYDFYGESEWRIMYVAELLENKRIVDPRDPTNEREHKYFQTLKPAQQEKLRFLMPLDGWFQMLIYPSISAKNLAQKDAVGGIKEEISRIKSLRDHGNAVENGNWPIEVNLDSCRNF